MEQDKTVQLSASLPANVLLESRKARLANIFFNISVASLILVALCLLSSIITPLLFVFTILVLLTVEIVMILCTLGAVFVMKSKPASKVWQLLVGVINSSESLMNITAFCFNITKWIALVGVITSVISLIAFALNKRDKSIGKITGLIFFIILLGVVFAIHVLTGGAQ